MDLGADTASGSDISDNDGNIEDNNSNIGNVSLSYVLQRYTSSIPVSEMNAWEKGQMLVATLLGYPNMRGNYRPHDLPLNVQATSAQELVHWLNRLVFNPELPIENWQIELVDDPVEATPGLMRFTDFVQVTALFFNGLSGREGGDPESGEAVWNTLGQFFLLLLQQSAIRYTDRDDDSLAADARRAQALLDFPRRLATLRKAFQKNRKSIKQKLEAIARNNCPDAEFQIVRIKINKIQEYIDRWSQLAMQRGASALVYYTIVVLREALIQRFGPAAVIHDYAGSLMVLLPTRPGMPVAIDEGWVRQALIDAADSNGWFARHFPRSMRYLLDEHDPEHYLIEMGLPTAGIAYLETALSLKDLSNWTWQEIASRQVMERRIPEKGSGDCPRCQRFRAVGVPFRYTFTNKDENRFRLCPICNLVAGAGAAFSQRFSASLLELPGKGSNLDFSLPQRRSRSQQIADEKGEVAVVYADGDQVGKLIQGGAGVHRLRRLALEIYRDVHSRLRLAVIRGWNDFVSDDGFLALDLQWIGGDDLVIRCTPKALKHLQNAFLEGGGIFGYTIEYVIIRNEEANVGHTMTELRERVKRSKELL